MYIYDKKVFYKIDKTNFVRSIKFKKYCFCNRLVTNLYTIYYVYLVHDDVVGEQHIYHTYLESFIFRTFNVSVNKHFEYKIIPSSR